MEILIISGLSGAGKSRVAAALEDLDFYCVDNMPVAMMPMFAELCLAMKGRYERVALVTDVRTGNFDEFFDALNKLSEMGCGHRILFIEAELETIVKRYKETRRRHPLALDGDIAGAVSREMEMLAAVRERADYIIDTTGLTLGQLQRDLTLMFSSDPDSKPLTVNIVSFGYKHGIPIDADLVFDARFLPNPFYVQELRDHTGLDKCVYDYVLGFDQTREFIKRLMDLISFLLPQYTEEGKSHIVICIGCTGGHHRSVVTAAALADGIEQLGYTVTCRHRDIKK